MPVIELKNGRYGIECEKCYNQFLGFVFKNGWEEKSDAIGAVSANWFWKTTYWVDEDGYVHYKFYCSDHR